MGDLACPMGHEVGDGPGLPALHERRVERQKSLLSVEIVPTEITLLDDDGDGRRLEQALPGLLDTATSRRAGGGRVD